MQGPPQLREATLPNLERPLKELFSSTSDVTVTDRALPFNLVLRVSLS